MKQIPQEIIDFLRAQDFIVVSSIDENGFPHSACKSMVKIDAQGIIYLIDLYHGVTSSNIGRDFKISISAIDEQKFLGYCLKGKAKVMRNDPISQEMIKTWEDNITTRLANRLLRNLAKGQVQENHPEASLPGPKYIIALEVEQIVDLTPHNLRKEGRHG